MPMCIIRAKIMKSEIWRIKKDFEFLIFVDTEPFFFLLELAKHLVE